MSGKTCWTKKLCQKFQQENQYYVNYVVWILNARIILRGKVYECGKFLWKHTRKESFMFWLRNWSYFITSLCLIICCIQQFHWLIILSNNLFRYRVDFFSKSRTEEKFQYKENKLLWLSSVSLRKVKHFLTAEKFMK